MSWVRIWLHIVFTTKNRFPLLKKEIRPKIFQHMKENALEKGLIIREINGYNDHAHILMSLNKEITISKSIQLIKGESSFWINKNKLTNQKFAWQDDYWAVSVSESHVKVVSQYIRNQEIHHSKASFTNELEQFLSKYDK